MQECNLTQMFKNSSEEEEIFPLTTPEIAEAQKADVKLKHCFKHNAVLGATNARRRVGRAGAEGQLEGWMCV